MSPMVKGQCIQQNCSAEIDRIETREEELDRYICEHGHSNTRRIYHDEVETFKHKGRIAHETAGIILYRGNEIYLQKRNRAPAGFTPPAGHIDKADDSPEEAAVRELREETDVFRDEEELVKVDAVILENDRCTKGADTHEWHIYATEIREDDSISLNHESSTYKWVNMDEIHSDELTPATQMLLDQEILSDGVKKDE